MLLSLKNESRDRLISKMKYISNVQKLKYTNISEFTCIGLYKFSRAIHMKNDNFKLCSFINRSKIYLNKTNQLPKILSSNVDNDSSFRLIFSTLIFLFLILKFRKKN